MSNLIVHGGTPLSGRIVPSANKNAVLPVLCLGLAQAGIDWSEEPVPVAPAMSFVEQEYQVIALYHQNELHQVAPGNEAEIALITKPGATRLAPSSARIDQRIPSRLRCAGSSPKR